MFFIISATLAGIILPTVFSYIIRLRHFYWVNAAIRASSLNHQMISFAPQTISQPARFRYFFLILHFFSLFSSSRLQSIAKINMTIFKKHERSAIISLAGVLNMVEIVTDNRSTCIAIMMLIISISFLCPRFA